MKRKIEIVAGHGTLQVLLNVSMTGRDLTKDELDVEVEELTDIFVKGLSDKFYSSAIKIRKP